MIDLPQADIDRIFDDFERYCRESHERFVAAQRGRGMTIASIEGHQPWWIVICNTSHERRATLGLRDAGFEVWAPETWREVTIGGGRAKSQACKRFAAAPGYLFTRHADRRAWPRMVGIDGVMQVRVWRHDWTPQTVPAAQIEAWRERLAPGAMPVVEDAYRVGSDVRVTEGPFAGFGGTVERFLGSRGVWVAVSAFGRSMAVRIDRRQVEAA